MKAKKSSSNDHSMIETDSCAVLWEKIENKMYSLFEHKRIKYKGDDTSAAYCFSIKCGGQIQFEAISPTVFTKNSDEDNLIEEERRKDERVTWDGYTSSVKGATRASRAKNTLENQIHQIHKVKGLLPDGEKEKIGSKPVAEAPNTSKLPTSVSAVPMPAQPQQPVQPQVEPAMPIPPPMMMPPMRLPMMPSFSGYQQTIPPLVSGGHLPANFQQSTLPPVENNAMNFMMKPSVPAHDEPPNKKQRSEDNSIPETEFIATHKGAVSLQVQAPSGDKPGGI
ncbi:splicing factor 3A subunit 1-like [Sitodiplosis mosellana]|uniref:splicing factor 3A subunit 1-like n=1 Tax=Sitodiplosis mosellana TaxID=263140 RepID=UPI0024450521|nr:splicing factor 3A subunit 1-like [Sitodiplosis mosellana]